MLTEDLKTRHLPFLQEVADADVQQLLQKDKEYGASWKSRGGVGAFMMLARKWDRLENMVKAGRVYLSKDADDHDHTTEASAYDIFRHALGSQRERGDAEALLDTIGDLRRYLLLVEGEVLAASGAVPKAATEAGVHEMLAAQVADLPVVERSERDGDLWRQPEWDPNSQLGTASVVDPRRDAPGDYRQPLRGTQEYAEMAADTASDGIGG